MAVNPKVLAVASRGGHWIQLRRLAPALAACDVVYASTDSALRDDVPGERFVRVRDANRDEPWGCLVLFFQILRTLLSVRPDVVLSTGAAPGCLALVLGRALGARTIWLDSIANVEQLSLSGRLVRAFAGLWLTQWPDLAHEQGPEFAGTVL